MSFKLLKSLLMLQKDIFIVGGALRDRYLNLLVTDFDIVSKDAHQLAKIYAEKIKVPLIRLDDTPGRETYRIISKKNNTIDISKMQGDSIEEDLARRDFTINAMAQPLEDFLNGQNQVLDPFQGQADLKKKVICALPGNVFKCDPLRILRAYRFAAKFQFKIEPQTQTKITQEVSGLDETANERIMNELLLFWSEKKTFDILRQMDTTGIWLQLFPETKSLLEPLPKPAVISGLFPLFFNMVSIIAHC